MGGATLAGGAPMVDFGSAAGGAEPMGGLPTGAAVVWGGRAACGGPPSAAFAAAESGGPPPNAAFAAAESGGPPPNATFAAAERGTGALPIAGCLAGTIPTGLFAVGAAPTAGGRNPVVPGGATDLGAAAFGSPLTNGDVGAGFATGGRATDEEPGAPNGREAGAVVPGWAAGGACVGGVVPPT